MLGPTLRESVLVNSSTLTIAQPPNPSPLTGEGEGEGEFKTRLSSSVYFSKEKPERTIHYPVDAIIDAVYNSGTEWRQVSLPRCE